MAIETVYLAGGCYWGFEDLLSEIPGVVDTEGTKETTFVRMEKWLVNQNPNVACIKYKSSSDEKNGQYVFFGIAAC